MIWKTDLMNMYLTRLGENTSLYFYPQHGPSLKIFAPGILLFVHVIRFLYNSAVVASEGSTSPISDFFLTDLCDLQRPANQNNNRLHVTKFHRKCIWQLMANTGIEICMSTSKFSLAIAGSRVSLLLIVHLPLSNELSYVWHSLTRLGTDTRLCSRWVVKSHHIVTALSQHSDYMH